MSWIDMSDRDKLFKCAKDFASENSRIFGNREASDTFYYCCSDNSDTEDIAEYSFDNLIHFKEMLINMWKDSDYTNYELLSKIISAIVFKNMPHSKNKNGILINNKTQKFSVIMKEISENLNEDEPPEYIYEF